MTLSARDALVLDIAARDYRYPGSREAAIREELDMSGVVWAQHLVRLLRDPDALAHDPATVLRWQRILARRRAARTGHRHLFA